MSDVKQEAWECKSCGNDAPCRVEVMFEETEYPHIEEQPRFAKWYWSFCVCSDRHDAKWTKCIDEANYATLLTRHNALREAVRWERECGTVSFTDLWFDEWNRNENQSQSAMQELRFTRRAARAEVDRILAMPTEL